MKSVKTFAILALVGWAFIFSACSETESVDESLALAEKSVEAQYVQGDTCTYDGILTPEEEEGLVFMREEEKLARDVYLHFYGIYADAIFQNIANSEEAHTNAVLKLLEGYEIDDPAMEEKGEFSNQELAALYLSFTTEGEKGLVEALTVGATIEDLDIKDLKERLEINENEDVERVYENLLAGSENHMRAFVKALEALDATYEPQFITITEFEEILAGENTKGNGNKGNKQGYSGKGNNGTNGGGQNGTGTEECDGTQTGSGNTGVSGSGTGNAYGNGGTNGKRN